MFYEDLFDIEEEYDKPKRYNPPMGSIYEVQREKRFYKLYSAFMNCHVIMINNHMYEHILYPINSMKPGERILEVSYLDDIHFFDVESFMEAKTHSHHLVLKNTKNKEIKLLPTQLRSMVTDGKIDLGK
tara:strand:+ start:110 stop:496 length:387 start_codon:yes stop_codon:yes gene_type:complete